MYTQSRIASIDDAELYCRRDLEKKLQRAADMFANGENTLKACLEAVGITDAEFDFYFHTTSEQYKVILIYLKTYTIPDCMSGMIDRFFAMTNFEVWETPDEKIADYLAFGPCAFEIDGILYDVDTVQAQFKTMNEFVEYVKAGKEL